MAHVSLDQLNDHIERGSIRMIHIVGVPRSISTALGRALNESDTPSIFVNEPFNREITGPNGAARQILLAALPLMHVQEEPVAVIVKNMASHMSPEAYAAIAPLPSTTVWAIRHPLIQIGSLVTRLANDIRIRHGADTITQEDLTPEMLDEVCALLADSPRSHNFSKTGWESIDRHWRNTIAERSIVIDGEPFAQDPLRILQAASLSAGLRFNPRMASGWTADFVNVINRDNSTETVQSAWTSHAATTTGITATMRPPIELSRLPAPLRRHIIDIALPVYHSMATQAL